MMGVQVQSSQQYYTYCMRYFDSYVKVMEYTMVHLPKPTTANEIIE